MEFSILRINITDFQTHATGTEGHGTIGTSRLRATVDVVVCALTLLELRRFEGKRWYGSGKLDGSQEDKAGELRHFCKTLTILMGD